MIITVKFVIIILNESIRHTKLDQNLKELILFFQSSNCGVILQETFVVENTFFLIILNVYFDYSSSFS